MSTDILVTLTYRLDPGTGTMTLVEQTIGHAPAAVTVTASPVERALAKAAATAGEPAPRQPCSFGCGRTVKGTIGQSLHAKKCPANPANKVAA